MNYTVSASIDFSKTNRNSDKNVLISVENNSKIRSTDALECHGGCSGRPEASRGLKSSIMNDFGSPLGPHFEGSSRSRRRSKGLWKRSQMRIA